MKVNCTHAAPLPDEHPLRTTHVRCASLKKLVSVAKVCGAAEPCKLRIPIMPTITRVIPVPVVSTAAPIQIDGRLHRQQKPLARANFHLHKIPILAPADVVQQRLEACKSCDQSQFENGILTKCKMCGCSGTQIKAWVLHDPRFRFDELEPCRLHKWRLLTFLQEAPGLLPPDSPSGSEPGASVTSRRSE